jgi:hypothetical protein
MAKNVTITLTELEGNALLDLLNLAVKTGGLENNVAGSALYFAKKIKTAFGEEVPKSIEGQLKEPVNTEPVKQ